MTENPIEYGTLAPSKAEFIAYENFKQNHIIKKSIKVHGENTKYLYVKLYST